ncbi:nuclear transport factor 2 family protein [Bradyrhizobium sp. 62B]|uniref:nuclear transport factor 2 family protein n=1 Tax=Bradyrhizobium sp. 62B TaxID=2898442 RepID=UPI002557E525|nr:nuclear transport factor 2 family protein [Bradyrhizobium sp. 62B]
MDPMTAALDWFEAYRAGKIEAILKMYATDAVIQCGCEGMKTVAGPNGRRAYWINRLERYPASELVNLQPRADGALISYVGPGGVVSAVLQFNADGSIASHNCGPAV